MNAVAIGAVIALLACASGPEPVGSAHPGAVLAPGDDTTGKSTVPPGYVRANSAMNGMEPPMPIWVSGRPKACLPKLRPVRVQRRLGRIRSCARAD